MCILRLLRVSNLCEHRTKAVFGPKLMVGGSEHKVVLDESGFRAFCVGVDCVLNFLSVYSRLWPPRLRIYVPLFKWELRRSTATDRSLSKRTSVSARSRHIRSVESPRFISPR